MTITINGYTIDETSTIGFVPNPKRPGFKAHARYKGYQKATTLAGYIAIANTKFAKADLRHDEEHGFLKIFNADREQINKR